MGERGQAWVNDAFDNGPCYKVAVNKNINNPSLTLRQSMTMAVRTVKSTALAGI